MNRYVSSTLGMWAQGFGASVCLIPSHVRSTVSEIIVGDFRRRYLALVRRATVNNGARYSQKQSSMTYSNGAKL